LLRIKPGKNNPSSDGWATTGTRNQSWDTESHIKYFLANNGQKYSSRQSFEIPGNQKHKISFPTKQTDRLITYG
jgi:hypothetical protein